MLPRPSSRLPPTVIPPLSTVIPAQAGIRRRFGGQRAGLFITVRDSRLRGNDGRGRPGSRLRGNDGRAAGMAGCRLPDSRLRGNDGRGGRGDSGNWREWPVATCRVPAYAGMTVGVAGKTVRPDWIPVGTVKAAGNFPKEILPFGKFPEKRYNRAGKFPGTIGE